MVAAGPAHAAQVSSRGPVTADLPVKADTWVDEASPETSHAQDQELVARLADGKGSRILIAFDFSDLEGAEITSASLTLSSKGGGGQEAVQIAVSGIKAAWGAKTTWHTQPERTSTYSIVDVPSAEGPIAWDVASLLKENLGLPGGLHGLALNGPVVASGAAFDRSFRSMEDAPDKVKLTVTYTPAISAAPEQQQPLGSDAVRVAIGATALVAIVITAIMWRKRREKGVVDG